MHPSRVTDAFGPRNAKNNIQQSPGRIVPE
jgi:hypothetical protein